MQDINNIDNLIVKSFSEGLNTYEQQQLAGWLTGKMENRVYYMQLKNLWYISRPVFDPDTIDVGSAEQRVSAKMDKSFWPQILGFIWWQRAAAILLLTVLLLTGYYMIHHRTLPQQLAYQEMKSPYGIISRVNLPDGTVVWLNSGSQLWFPIVFKGSERHVKLSGEGFFEVHSDKKHPFIVETSRLNVKATGTRFNVEAYISDTIVAVTLVEGKVDVNVENKIKKNLYPDQRIVYNSNTHKYNLATTDAQQSILWKDGKLVFMGESLNEVCSRLSKVFNVEISIKDKSIANQSYRATFDGESLDEILQLLKLTAPIRFVRYKKMKQPDNTYNKEKIEIYKID